MCQIRSLYTDGANYDNIAHALSREHDITVSAKTIQRRIKDWDVPGQRTAIEPDETLLAFIECLLRDGHRPKRCVEILNSNGVSMTQRQFRTIRTDFLGIRLRVDSQQHREDQARDLGMTSIHHSVSCEVNDPLPRNRTIHECFTVSVKTHGQPRARGPDYLLDCESLIP